MAFYWLTLGVLATWRVTHLLNAEDGPWNVLVRLRRAAGDGVLGDLLDCFNCLSLIVALPIAAAVVEGWIERALLWLALSAGAIVLERLTARAREAAPAVRYFEVAEEDDEQLGEDASADDADDRS
ncbi:MAG TPA: hypothetical protein VMI72_13315 [Roseiarcus sp.]|nr:hypothetical protein [Roseiarcus sp.]